MDAYGKGLLSYYSGNKKAKFKVESDIAETEYWPVGEFFHEYKDMGEIEKKALAMCKGRTLDVGAGSGSHVVYLQSQGIDTHAIDISEGAIEVMTKRGVKCADKIDFFDLEGRQYDTLLMLMNGAGIVGKIARLPEFFGKIKMLLAPGGQVLMDSSDLKYLYEDEDGSFMVDLNAAYYGELNYTMSYGGEKDPSFDWLFIDYDTLEDAAEQCGLKCEKVYEDDHYQYLVRMTIA